MLLNDILEAGFKLPNDAQRIVSMTEASAGHVVIVTDTAVYEARAVAAPHKFEVRLIHNS